MYVLDSDTLVNQICENAMSIFYLATWFLKSANMFGHGGPVKIMANKGQWPKISVTYVPQNPLGKELSL